MKIKAISDIAVFRYWFLNLNRVSLKASSQNLVTAYLKREQLLHYGFALHRSTGETLLCWFKSHAFYMRGGGGGGVTELNDGRSINKIVSFFSLTARH